MPVDIRNQYFRRLRSLDICVYCPIPGADWALIELAHACPLLEVFILSCKKLQTLSLYGFYGTNVLPKLKELVPFHVSPVPEAAANMIEGRGTLRKLQLVFKLIAVWIQSLWLRYRLELRTYIWRRLWRDPGWIFSRKFTVE